MKRFVSILLILIVLLAGIGILYVRPVPGVQAVTEPPKLGAAQAPSIPWPNYGQEAFGAAGFGVLASNGSQRPVPIASLAKVATALSVLQKYPLAIGETGPELTMTDADVALYQKYVGEDGSVVLVNAGEQISEYQALQAMLLPSANNMADSLADWAFGSETSYVSYANAYMNTLGLSQTHLDDSSGFSPQSVSTAHDLVILGEQALANPVLAAIVDQSQATVPVAGTISNVDWLLGTDGVIGIKTGNTDQAGGCFLFAAKRMIAGQQVMLVGAILGAPTLQKSMDDSVPIINSSDNNFQMTQIVKKGQSVGLYTSLWGSNSPAVASQDLAILTWKGTKPSLTVKLNKLSSSADISQNVGSLTVIAGPEDQSITLLLQKNIDKPSFWWRIFH